MEKKDYPLHPVGQLTLNCNPENYFAEVEQAAFSPAHTVPGIDVSPDRMLQGRLFSYSDTHRHRLGANYTQIPINQPKCRVANHQRDGFMAGKFELDPPYPYDHELLIKITVSGNGGSAPNYEPNSFGGPYENNLVATTFTAEEVSGLTGRYTYELTDDDFVQAGDLYRLMAPEEKTDLVSNIAGHLKNAKKHIRERQIAHFKRTDPEYGQRIEETILTLLSKA